MITLLEANEAVRVLLLKGSSANLSLQVDTWSDVDVTIIVADGALEVFFPTIAWLAPLGAEIGLPKTALPHVFTAPAINLIRLDAFLEGKKAAKTRVSRFAAFVPVDLAG